MKIHIKKYQFSVKSRFKESKCPDGGHSLNQDFWLMYKGLKCKFKSPKLTYPYKNPFLPESFADGASSRRFEFMLLDAGLDFVDEEFQELILIVLKVDLRARERSCGSIIERILRDCIAEAVSVRVVLRAVVVVMVRPMSVLITTSEEEML